MENKQVDSIKRHLHYVIVTNGGLFYNPDSTKFKFKVWTRTNVSNFTMTFEHIAKKETNLITFSEVSKAISVLYGGNLVKILVFPSVQDQLGYLLEKIL